MKTRLGLCPSCSEQYVSNEVGELYCPKCKGTPTSEGLVARRAATRSPEFQEVGKGGHVIWQYRKGQQNVDILVQKISELESRCEELGRVSPTPIDVGVARWNLNSAIRRLRRWMLENNNTPLVIADGPLRECASSPWCKWSPLGSSRWWLSVK